MNPECFSYNMTDVLSEFTAFTRLFYTVVHVLYGFISVVYA